MTQIEELDGLITPKVGGLLATLAMQVLSGTAIVEIGSYRGKSTAYLAAAAPKDVPIYAVDPWEMLDINEWCHWCPKRMQPTLGQFIEQLESVGLAHRVVIMQDFSVFAADNYAGPPISLLYIDGDHSREAVVADFLAWRPHFAPVATVVFDDYGVTYNPGVKEAIEHLELEVQVTADQRLAIATVVTG